MPSPDPRTSRLPCPWCEQSEMWPDVCDEETGDRSCATTIERRCMSGDHRRCGITKCTFAARWHEEVRQAGVAAAATACRTWAVVSTIGNSVDVIGTEDDLGLARICLAGALWQAGRHVDPEGLGLVYLVRAGDGGFV